MLFQSKKSERGYTLLEILIIAAIIGILCAIAAPSWLGFLARLSLNAAQAEALTIIRDAQAKAKLQKRVWEACFWQNDSERKVQWSVHPTPQSEGNICTNAKWQNLLRADADKIAIDSNRSTLQNNNNIYRVRFNHKGWVHGQLGRMTFMARNQNGSRSRRCVFVSTLLGATRTTQDRGCDGD
jgi:type II secretory pathway pseudopilin PulG